jgi:hypothetical protein
LYHRLVTQPGGDKYVRRFRYRTVAGMVRNAVLFGKKRM